MRRYPPSLTLMAHEHYYPCHWASYIIPWTVWTPWGVCSPCCQMCSATSFNQTQLPSLPSKVPIYTPGWREAIIVKCLAQGHKYHGRGQDSNSHSDDSAIRTQVRCTKPLGHGTPYNRSSSRYIVKQPATCEPFILLRCLHHEKIVNSIFINSLYSVLRGVLERVYSFLNSNQKVF